MIGEEFQTTLSYVVELEPKLWVPVRLLEGRICKEIKTNLICIREEAERIQRLLDEVIVTIAAAQLFVLHVQGISLCQMSFNISSTILESQ